MSGNTVFLIDRFAFDRIERLVRRYEKKTKDVQSGGTTVDRTMRLTPKAYANLDTSNM